MTQGQRIRQIQQMRAGAAPLHLRPRLVLPRRAGMSYLEIAESEESGAQRDRAQRRRALRRELKSLLAFVFAAGLGFGAMAAIGMFALLG